MKFLLRCFLVLGIAVLLGILLYYTVQALPGATPALSRPGSRLESQSGNNVPGPTPRPEHPENERGDGPRLRSILGIFAKIALFTILVFVAVLAKRFVFERKPGRKAESN